MPCRRVRTPVEQLHPFERDCIVGLREAGWTYQWIVAHVGHNVSVVCRCFQQWSVEHSHTHRPGSGWLHSTHIHTHQYRHIVQAVVLPEQHWGKKFRSLLHLLCHQGPIGTICLQQDSDHVCLWPGYHLHHHTTKHGYSGIMKEWNGSLLSSMMRIGSVFMQVMDVHVYGIDLVSDIFWSAFTHNT